MTNEEEKRYGSKTLLLFIAPGLIVLLFIFRCCTRGDAGPSYDGRSLKEWLEIYEDSAFVSPNSSTTRTAEAAVRKIGTNGVPAMLRWITYEPSPWRQFGDRILVHTPVIVRHVFRDRRSDELYAARDGFEILGPAATPAASELAHIMRDPQAQLACSLVIDALGAIGTNGLPFLLGEVEDTQAPGRWFAILRIARMQDKGIDVEQGASVLLQFVPSNGYFAGDAGYILVNLVEHSPSGLSMVVSNLDSTNKMTQLGAIEILGAAGGKADGCAPDLRKLLSSADYNVRSAASNALENIAQRNKRPLEAAQP
jgi:hypothetical protein